MEDDPDTAGGGDCLICAQVEDKMQVNEALQHACAGLW
jgi:hypothetical protein